MQVTRLPPINMVYTTQIMSTRDLLIRYERRRSWLGHLLLILLIVVIVLILISNGMVEVHQPFVALPIKVLIWRALYHTIPHRNWLWEACKYYVYFQVYGDEQSLGLLIGIQKKNILKKREWRTFRRWWVNHPRHTQKKAKKMYVLR